MSTVLHSYYEVEVDINEDERKLCIWAPSWVLFIMMVKKEEVTILFCYSKFVVSKR